MTTSPRPGEFPKDPFAAPGWSEGLDLVERLRQAAVISPCDAGLAARRLGRWRDEPPFAEAPDLWRRRLAAIGLDEARLLALLGEPPEDLHTRAADELWWLEELREAYVPDLDARALPWPEEARERFAFLPFVTPLVRRARTRLHSRAHALAPPGAGIPFDAESTDALLAHIPELLAPIINPALVVELHVARIEERLRGTTPEDRFREFVGEIGRPACAIEILARYPAMARQLVERVRQWEEGGIELFERLAADAGDLREHFDAEDGLDRLIEARGAVSDPHRGGRGVFLLRFASGLRLVYKPRPLAVERAFQELLAWSVERSFEPALSTLKVLERAGYGWMEWAEAAPCSSAEEVRRFYQRQGALIALFYLLDGTDFHHENLIAAGEHPMPVDLETLFQPWVYGSSLRDVARQPGASLHSNVMRSNLLPHRLWGDGERAGVDLSGLGAQDDQLTPKAVLASTERGTDQMRIERRQVVIPISENRPTLEGAKASLLGHENDLCRGFGRMYELFMTHRAELMAPDGPLGRFADADVRVLLRPTASYGALLLESFHPHLTSSALERQRFLDHLWGGVAERPFLEPLVPAELADLALGDVPHFTTFPDSRDLWTSSGERHEDFFEDSGLDRVRRRLERLSPEDRTRQEGMIRYSLETVRLAAESRPRASYTFRQRDAPARREELLNAARKVADTLVAKAFHGPEEALWATLEHREPEGWQITVTGPDLYQGLPGIAFFLAYLGHLAGSEVYTEVARRSVAIMAHQLEAEPSPLEGIGAFSGWGGVIYVLTHLGILWGQEELLDQAVDVAGRLMPLVEADEGLDIIAGAAGCLVTLLQLEAVRPSQWLRDTARACGERLLAKAEQREHGLGWTIPLAGSRALAGFSHGAAGIALALLQLAHATGDKRFRHAAQGGIDFERGLYDPSERNWPDLRVGTAEEAEPHGTGRFMNAWCHGAAGIGLARVAGLPFLDDTAVRDEVTAAVTTTLECGFGLNHCLCHGDLGNLHFLLDATRALGDDELRARVDRLAGGVLESIEEHSWLCGLQGNVETPGLMVGLAGVGYGLAWLAAPEQLPSVLRLAAPPNLSAFSLRSASNRGILQFRYRLA